MNPCHGAIAVGPAPCYAISLTRVRGTPGTASRLKSPEVMGGARASFLPVLKDVRAAGAAKFDTVLPTGPKT